MNDLHRITFAILSMSVIGIIFSQISEFYSVEGRDLGNFKSKNFKSSPGKIKNKEIKYDKPNQGKIKNKEIKYDKPNQGKIKNKEIKPISDNKGSVKKRPDCAKNGSCIGGGPDNIKPISDKIPSKYGSSLTTKFLKLTEITQIALNMDHVLGENHPNHIDAGDIDLNHFENVDLDIGDLEDVDINVDDIDISRHKHR